MEPAVGKTEPSDEGASAPPPATVTVKTMDGKSAEFPIEGFKRSCVNDWLGEKYVKIFKRGDDEPARAFVAGDVLFALPFVPDPDLTSDLIEACYYSDVAEVVSLLSERADPTDCQAMLTAMGGRLGTHANPEIMSLMIRHGRDVNQPLWICGACLGANCLWGLIEEKGEDDAEVVQAAQVLVDAGVDVNQKGTSTCSPGAETTPLRHLAMDVRFDWTVDLLGVLKSAGAVLDDPSLVRVSCLGAGVLRGSEVTRAEWFTVDECNTSVIAEWVGVDDVEFFEDFRCDTKVCDVLPGQCSIFARATACVNGAGPGSST